MGRNKNKGITLVETLITVAIIGIISTVSWQMFIHGFRMWRLNTAQLDVQKNGRIVMDIVERNLKQAQAGSVYITRHSADDPPYSKVVFNHINGSAYEYYQSGTDFYQSKDGNTKRFIRNLRSLMFAPVESGDDTIISVGICLESATYDAKTRVSKLSFQKVRIMN